MGTQASIPKQQALALLHQALLVGLRGQNRRAIQNAIDTINSDNKQGLTDLACKNLKIGDKPLRDTQCPGLRLEPKKKGHTWLHRFKFEDKQPQLNYGVYPDVPLAAAREKWAETQRALKAGKLPSEPCSAMTVDELCRKYIALAEKHKKSWREDYRQIKADILPLWIGKLASEITANDAVSKYLQWAKKTSKQTW